MAEELDQRPGETAAPKPTAVPLRPVSPHSVVYDGRYAYKVDELRSALTERERAYLDELRAQEHQAARDRVREVNERSPRGTPPLRYSKDVADARAWRSYHHRHHYSAERALASVEPVGNAPSRDEGRPETHELERETVEPRTVTTDSGERVSYNDLRSAVPYPDAVDDARDGAHDTLGRAPTAQETWDAFKNEWPGDARQAEALVAARAPQQHVEITR
jgi:hypothetical protein